MTVVERVLDAASGTFGVRLRLPNGKLLLPAGIRCKVQFEMRTAQTNWGAASSAAAITPEVSNVAAPIPALAETRQR